MLVACGLSVVEVSEAVLDFQLTLSKIKTFNIAWLVAHTRQLKAAVGLLEENTGSVT